MMSAQTLPLPRILRLDTWAVRLGLILAVLLAVVQYGAPGLVGVDGYYHIKMASLMRGDLTPEFTWLPLTILSPDAYVDHHWLFHVLLIPFTGGNLVTGGQVASVVFGTAAIFAAGWLLRSQNVPASTVWAVLIFVSSSAFVYRMSMVRTQSLSLLWMLLALHLLFQRRERWLVPLGLTYVWLYNAFPLLLVLAGVFFVAARLTEGEWRWGAVIYPAIGIALGLIINPYFPNNLVFIYHHLIAKLDIAAVKVGNEWYPYTTTQLLSNAGLAMLAFIGGTLALGRGHSRASLPAVTMFGMSLVFGIMLMQSRRFVEYFPPFAVMFCAFACQPFLAKRTLLTETAAAALITLAIVMAPITMRDARSSVMDSLPAEQFAGASQWLAANTPEGSMVFQTDWDDFTRLFFHNSHNSYIVGLDPTYLQRADSDLYHLWVDLTQGRGLDLSDGIRQHFGAEYAVSDLKHTAFLERAANDPQMKEVYRDDNSVVFAVLEP